MRKTITIECYKIRGTRGAYQCDALYRGELIASKDSYQAVHNEPVAALLRDLGRLGFTYYTLKIEAGHVTNRAKSGKIGVSRDPNFCATEAAMPHVHRAVLAASGIHDYDTRRQAVIDMVRRLPSPIAPRWREFIANKAWSTLGHGGGI